MPPSRIKRGPSRTNSSRSLQALRILLEAIAPSAGEVARDAALASILEALEDYRQAFPIANGARRNQASASVDRKKLIQLRSLLVKTKIAVDNLPVGAMRAFCNSYGPRGSLTQRLTRVEQDVDAALEELSTVPDKTTDNGLAMLALDVARVLVNLGLRVTMTRDRGDITGTRGGAKYARVLRATLKVAGVPAPEDLLPIMKKGKQLHESMPSE